MLRAGRLTGGPAGTDDVPPPRARSGSGDAGGGRLPARDASGAVDALFVGPASRSRRTARLGRGGPAAGRAPTAGGGDRHLVRAVRGAGPVAPPGARGVLRGRRCPRSWRAGRGGSSCVIGGALLLKGSLLFEPGVVVTDVPLVQGRSRPDGADRPVEPERSVVLVPVSAVHDADGPRRGLRQVAPSDHRGRRRSSSPIPRSPGWSSRPGTSARWTSRCLIGRRRSATSASRCCRDARPHVKGRHRGHRGPARARALPLVGEPAPQPDRVLPQADAAVRAERRGHERALPPP